MKRRDFLQKSIYMGSALMFPRIAQAFGPFAFHKYGPIRYKAQQDFSSLPLGAITDPSVKAINSPSIVSSTGSISGKGVRAGTSNYTDFYDNRTPMKSSNMEALGIFKTASSRTTNTTYMGFRVRSDIAAGNLISIGILEFAGGCRITTYKYWGGSFAQLVQTDVTRPSASTRYYLRVRLTGTTAQAKYWVVGNTEPASWSWSHTATEYTYKGTLGIWLNDGSTTANTLSTCEWYAWDYTGGTIVPPV